MYLEQFFIEGLGCASYLVGDEGAGLAAVVDPDREVDKYLRAAAAHGLTITHVIETHLHADHVSGSTELRARTGADIYLHEAAGVAFPHRPLRAGDTLELGNLHLAVRHTPGHTPDSITLLVTDLNRAKEPWMALTGDTLFVGDVGRPDLVGPDAARGLASQMYDTLQREILPLPDGVLVFPGHGAGSLCGKALTPVRSTTIGYERHHNPALFPLAREAFIDFAVADLPEQPANVRRIKGLNRRGPRPLGEVTPRPVAIRESIAHFQGGAALLDLRDAAAFRTAHIPGAIHLELDDQLSNRVGFVLPPDAPIILLLGEPPYTDLAATYRRAVYALARVGYDEVVGYLAEGLDVWAEYGLPLAAGDVREITPAQLSELLAAGDESAPVVIDVREPWEYAQGRVPGARLIPLGELLGRVGELDAARPTALICATGSRSRSAAALLGQQGFETVYNVAGGTVGWMEGGLPLER
ncbi:rhodanese-like domain-containing protein [Promineifilum sp.]|uniref:MBL fold metallo-hydrolase n=1 Tax=Promineifilum sp. TaxID=2664178 RepID=UPI0035B313BA